MASDTIVSWLNHQNTILCSLKSEMWNNILLIIICLNPNSILLLWSHLVASIHHFAGLQLCGLHLRLRSCQPSFHRWRAHDGSDNLWWKKEIASCCLLAWKQLHKSLFMLKIYSMALVPVISCIAWRMFISDETVISFFCWVIAWCG